MKSLLLAVGVALASALACAAEQRPSARAAGAPQAGESAEPCPEPLPVATSPAGVAPPALPTVRLEKEPIQFDDEAYTVWGASYYLRSKQHRAEVTRETIRITGYVTRTNLPEAPACAVHRAGKAEPENCKSPSPAFWLGDSPDAPEADSLQVLGFASSFPQIYEAILVFDRGKPGERYIDTLWGVTLPNPLPARGARVTVQGRLGTSFTKASSGVVTDTTMGILTFEEMLTLRPASEPATLPGVTRKKR